MPDDRPSDLRLWYMIVAGVGLLLVLLIGGSLFFGGPPADPAPDRAAVPEGGDGTGEAEEEPVPRRSDRRPRGGMNFLATLPEISGDAQPTEADPRTWNFVADVCSEGQAPIDRWEWDFGDGGTSGGREATHTFAEGGDYRVRVTAFDEAGRRSADYFTIWVRPAFLDSGDVSNLEPGLRCEVYDLDELGRKHVAGELAGLEPTAIETVTEMVAGGHGHDDDFALAFVGYLVIPETGTYRFTVAADDFVHLRVAGAKPFSSEYDGGFKDESREYPLEKGVYPIRLEFEEEGGEEEIRFRIDRVDGDGAERIRPVFLHRPEGAG